MIQKIRLHPCNATVAIQPIFQARDFPFCRIIERKDLMVALY
jgi:hypothetical protein